MRKTKIVCTIGPASHSEKVLKALIQAGMDVARLNFSHGDHTFHARTIKRIRQIAQALGKPVALLQDLAGPKIRIGPIEGDRTRLPTGRTFVLTKRKILGNSQVVSVDYPRLGRVVKKGDPILLGDGEIELEAAIVRRDEITCHIIVGGDLGSRKGIYFPKGGLDLPSLTPKDKRDLAFGIEQEVDLVALSFVRTRQDIVDARREIKKRGARVPILAKIEKHEALDHIDAILEEVDAIMVARGDLGLEMPLERIPVLQKMMIHKANRLGKPVITATQMLRSMVQNPRPTRAEVADIANAVLDGTDALMLSEESAVGRFPVQSVRTMAEVATETEKILEPRHQFEGLTRSVPEAISHAAISLARDLRVKAFLIPTASGSTVRMIARYRPTQPLIAISPNLSTVKMLSLVWGVYPLLIPAYRSTDAMIRVAKQKALALRFVKKGDLVAITAGLPLHKAGTTNLITVQPIE